MRFAVPAPAQMVFRFFFLFDYLDDFSHQFFRVALVDDLPVATVHFLDDLLDAVRRAARTDKDPLRLMVFECYSEFVQRSHPSANGDDRVGGAHQEQIPPRIVEARVHDEIEVIRRKLVRLDVRHLGSGRGNTDGDPALFFRALRRPVRDAGRGARHQHRVLAHDLAPHFFGKRKSILGAVRRLRRARHANFVFQGRCYFFHMLHIISYFYASSNAPPTLTATASRANRSFKSWANVPAASSSQWVTNIFLSVRRIGSTQSKSFCWSACAE